MVFVNLSSAPKVGNRAFTEFEFLKLESLNC